MKALPPVALTQTVWVAGMAEPQYRNLAGAIKAFHGERFYSTGPSDNATKTGANFKERHVV